MLQEGQSMPDINGHVQLWKANFYKNVNDFKAWYSTSSLNTAAQPRGIQKWFGPQKSKFYVSAELIFDEWIMLSFAQGDTRLPPDLPYQSYEQAYLLPYLIDLEVVVRANTILYLKTIQYIKRHGTIGGLWSKSILLPSNPLLDKGDWFYQKQTYRYILAPQESISTYLPLSSETTYKKMLNTAKTLDFSLNPCQPRCRLDRLREREI